MPAPNRKRNKCINVNVRQSVYDLLCEHCEMTGQSKTVAVERALIHYCKMSTECDNTVDVEKTIEVN